MTADQTNLCTSNEPSSSQPAPSLKGRPLNVLTPNAVQQTTSAMHTLGQSVGKALLRAEETTKGALFDCHMCGQCILQQTALICPMRCPKGMRNGPCGGPSLEGQC